jgi:sugar/nucleoside kinase (ribokinase family)
VETVAVVGSLSRDAVADGPPRPGGAPFHAARGLRLLDRPALVVARCAEADVSQLLEPLRELGVPVRWLPAQTSAAFSFDYHGDVRRMQVDAVGDAWTPVDAAAVADAGAVHVGALFRGEFPAETLQALGAGRLLSLDGQGLVRSPELGPLRLDGTIDRAVLAHVDVLKLADDEARALVGEPAEGALASLGVAEVVVTAASRGALVWADGRLTHVPPRPLVPDADPTGAGDAFATAYLAARVDGAAPVRAAERAAELVGELLGSMT